MPVSIKQVAEKAKVSQSTVSVVFNNRTREIGISEKTRKHVLATAKELNYIPSFYARHISRKSTFTIGMIVRDVMRPTTAMVVDGVKSEATKDKYQIILGISSFDPEQERGYIKSFLSRRVDGLIVIPVASKETIKEVEELSSRGFPLVACKQAFMANVDSVIHDVEFGTYLAAKHLLELGHRRIACVYTDFSGPSAMDKYNGYRRAMQEYGFDSMSKELLITIDNNSKQEYGKIAGQKILAMDTLPDAVLFVNDEMASGAMNVLMDAGVRVPDDMSLIGFDGIIPADIFRVPLTTVRSPHYKIGQTAVKILMKKIEAAKENPDNQQEKQASPRQSIKLAPELIIRESTAPRK
ncbi:MAG: LacI family transcriptional regulator [Anaerohalosphaeraceae bacterium]|nr:LacI family transcriptional regulator [Anaerohalosphaeraceae bacterium]